MAYVLRDRVKESTSTTGTGALTVTGAVTACRTFAASGLPAGSTFPYSIETAAGAWETGVGTRNANGTISRGFEDSSTGSLLNLTGAAGTTVSLAVTAGAATLVSVPATGANTPRTAADRAADRVNIKDFGAALDGTTDDTAALTAAQAAAGGRPVWVPHGVASVTTAYSGLTARIEGAGQIKTSDGFKRGRSYARRTSAPTSYGDQGNINQAFNGDLGTVHHAIEHRIEGATTLTQPAASYVMKHENAAISLSMINASGWNESTGDQAGGRTGVAAFASNIGAQGMGDTFFLNVGMYVTGTKTGSTHFLANTAAVGYAIGQFAFVDGAYLEADECSHDDAGFGGVGYDVAVSSTVRNFFRSNDTGAKGAWWLGTRYQTGGTKAVDVGFQLVGRWKNGIDTTGVIAGPDKAIWSQAAGQRTYLNATPFGDGFNNPAKTVFGTTYTHYNPTTSAYEVVVAGVVGFAVKSTGPMTGSFYLDGVLQSGNPGMLPRTDIYTTAGAYTWTRHPSASMVDSILIGPGGGGASGGVAASGASIVGGPGGSSGPVVRTTTPAALVPASVTGNVGVPGAGGVGTSTTGIGAAGSAAASNTTFPGVSPTAFGGAGGSWISTSTALGGLGGGSAGTGLNTGNFGSSNSAASPAIGGGNGGANGGGGGGGSGINGLLGGPAGGAAGGGVSSAGGANTGGTGGIVPGLTPNAMTAVGANGPAAPAPIIAYGPGGSGNGGGSAGSGGTGGNAGVGSGYGAGGSGGGSAGSGGTAGSGAAGMPGLVIIVQR